jgi:hypothetical protein
MPIMNAESKTQTVIVLNAQEFQQQLDQLANTIAYKVQREGSQHGLVPTFLAADVYFMLRQAQQTYNLFRFINADESRHKDVDWRVAYSAVILPLVRTMIDCFYNIATILGNPGPMGNLYRASGYRRTLEALDTDEKRYGSDPQWAAYVKKQRESLDRDMRTNGFAEAEVRRAPLWPTFSQYLADARAGALTEYQQFLQEFALGFWREYSAISHATFQGLLGIGLFLAPKDLPHEDWPRLDSASEKMIFVHVARVAAVLLCSITEIQASDCVGLGLINDFFSDGVEGDSGKQLAGGRNESVSSVFVIEIDASAFPIRHNFPYNVIASDGSAVARLGRERIRRTASNDVHAFA